MLDAGKGPELCLGGVADSFPPQCGGPPIDGWIWPSTGTQHAEGVTWGAFYVVGRYDGTRFTFNKTVSKDQAATPLPFGHDRDFNTPCPEPAGGWQPLDPSRSSAADRDRAYALADKLPDYTETWIDDRGAPDQNRETSVVNVQVAGSVTVAEQRLRTVWGGPLCVSKAAHSRKELDRVLQNQLIHERGFLGGGASKGILFISVIYDDGTLQRRLDQEYGAGFVRVSSALQPYHG